MRRDGAGAVVRKCCPICRADHCPWETPECIEYNRQRARSAAAASGLPDPYPEADPPNRASLRAEVKRLRREVSRLRAKGGAR